MLSLVYAGTLVQVNESSARLVGAVIFYQALCSFLCHAFSFVFNLDNVCHVASHLC